MRPSGGIYSLPIKTFEPDDTESIMHIADNWGGVELTAVRERIQAKWPGINDDELIFTAEHIQTDCIDYDRYDLYDPANYTNYIVIHAYAAYFERTKASTSSA